MKGKVRELFAGAASMLLILVISGCSTTQYPPLPTSAPKEPFTTDPTEYKYLVGPGDSLNIFVWGNPEVSASVTVRPDGQITTPLVEDVDVSGLTPTAIARKMEEVLSVYVKEPIISVTVGGFNGPYSEQIRIIGEATSPQSIPYSQWMTLLDVMIAVGGITEFADGNNASVFRIVDGQQQKYSIRIDDLIQNADISANVDILPGDIIIIPEDWF